MPFLRKRREIRKLHSAADVVRNSELFDPSWYVTQNAGGLKVKGDVALHYIRYGRRLGFDPGPRFSGKRYLEQYPDVAAQEIDPLVHYLRYGRYEERAIFGKGCAEVNWTSSSPRVEVSALGGQEPIQEPVNHSPPLPSRKFGRKALREQAQLIRQSEFFDEAWYADRNLGGARPRDSIVHYLTVGSPAGFDPGPAFSNSRYLAAYPDVAEEDIDPLVHFLLHGKSEGRMAFAVPLTQLRINTLGQSKECAPQTGGALAETAAALDASPQVTASMQTESPGILFISGEPDTPGNFYRVIYYLEAAKANGWRAESIRGDQLAQRMSEVSNFDVIVFWRMPWNANVEEAIGIARSRERTVAFDCDDLMTEPRLATFDFIDGIRSNGLTEQMVHDHFSLIRRTMLAADVCFTTTDQLAFHMRWSDMATFVNPNGFTQYTHDLSRRSARTWRSNRDDLIRIGYAGGSRTHQKDLAVAMPAISRILSEHPECRLVLFRSPHGDQQPLVDIEEFPELDGLHDQIEWRPMQSLRNLPTEKARFDINLAPLEVGNPFCEAKSELKFFETGLVDCPTVASPTGPFRDCISHGTTGFLAASGDDWYSSLKMLVMDADLRRRVGRNAYISALARFGPRRRALQFGCVLDQLRGGPAAARAFALSTRLASNRPELPQVYPSDVVFEADKGGQAEVAVVIPLYNYESVVEEALDSVRDQTINELDLIIVDGCSTDTSLQVALRWAQCNAARFNRIVVLKNRDNYKLGLCRNSGFDTADVPFVMLLDADNRLLPECCEKLLAAIKMSGSAFVYPTIQHFGSSTRQISNAPYQPQRFTAGNYVDAMAMVSKEAWAMVGGYHHVRHGWEDYDFWARIAEIGLVGEWLPEVLAEYRVHQTSMMKTQTVVDTNYRELHRDFASRHPWVALVDVETRRYPLNSDPRVTAAEDLTRLDKLIPMLRCPITGQKLAYDQSRQGLVSYDGSVRWPIKEGRPCLSHQLSEPQVMPADHISNELPPEALEVISETKGWVLNLSAGGSRDKFDHVVEMEFAVFRHTDVVGDAHHLPFEDKSFDAVVVMNAFEHYHDPRRVAAELFRVLKPGGRIHIRTAFLQPLHEKPYHFYNCTRYGMERWFDVFDRESLHVSSNFSPAHTLAWAASEAETALRRELTNGAADDFLNAPIGELVQLWRKPSNRDTALWNNFERLSQDSQEVIAAGFELFGKRPPDLPKL